MQHDAALSSLNDSHPIRGIAKAVLISVPLWSVIGAAVWLLQAVA